MKKTVELEVIKALQKEEYTLNTVNSYGENLLHISAANGCLDIIKEIFRKYDCCQIINRKNKFGWTPLMLAIRNRYIETVKYLLQKNANVNESTYLGMSVFGLAAAINKDMFETVYQACPSALVNSMNDDITPLCIAAMKNDKGLFFRLIELGFDVSKHNEYTCIMMKQSIVPEINNLAKCFEIENYWNDSSDNILVENEPDKKDHLNSSKLINKNNNNVFPLNAYDIAESNTDVYNNDIRNIKKYLKPHRLNLTSQLETVHCSLISPTFTCGFNKIIPASPNIYFTQNKHNNEIKFNIPYSTEDKQLTTDEKKAMSPSLRNKKSVAELPLQRLQSIRPPDLYIQNEEDEKEEGEEGDLNATLGYLPEFSPLRSPNVPADINDENVFGESTPTPPHYKTPPRGMILNSEDTKISVLLKRYGLSQHVPIFLKQEVDIDLFMTLTNEDLIEIGIKNEADRKVILDAIIDYTGQ